MLIPFLPIKSEDIPELFENIFPEDQTPIPQVQIKNGEHFIVFYERTAPRDC